MVLTTLQKLLKNVGNLGKIIAEWLPKVQKSPNLITLYLNEVNSLFNLLNIIFILSILC